MRKLILSSAVAAAAAFLAMTATPASAQNGGVPRFCYEQPEFFFVACQGQMPYTPKGYIEPTRPVMKSHHCNYVYGSFTRGAAPTISVATPSAAATE